MCIIAIKQAGISMPATKTIENMWHNNPDGAGFMYAKAGSVFIEKGFMKLKSLKVALKRFNPRPRVGGYARRRHSTRG